jgi:hypothetical protein
MGVEFRKGVALDPLCWLSELVLLGMTCAYTVSTSMPTGRPCDLEDAAFSSLGGALAALFAMPVALQRRGGLSRAPSTRYLVEPGMSPPERSVGGVQLLLSQLSPSQSSVPDVATVRRGESA